MSGNSFNNSTNCQVTTGSHNTTTNNNNVSNYYTVGDDLSPLLTWLSPLDPGLRHSDIQERRVDNVGEWLIRTEKFTRWCRLGGGGEDDNAVLFCYGNPGVGKTFISSLVVDRLCDQTGGQNTPVACFYFDFAARKEQTATSMLGSILKQVINGTERVPEDIWRALQKQKRAVSGRKPQLGDIVKILQLITSSQRTFMVIDALDECTAVQRFRLFDSLKEILQKSPSARVLMTGRPHICPEIEIRLAGRAISISVGPARDDIVRFLRFRLSEDEIPDAMDESLEADILEKIPGSISEMFLLASLNIEAILQEPTIYRRRERLSNMTAGLGLEDVYGATIERVKAQGGYKSRLGMGALMWISYAEVPLSPDELCHALAIELGSTDFNASNIPSIATLVSCCQGLITVDKEASTVRLIHFTLREYLSVHPDIFSRPHSAIAEICLTYLNSCQVKALSAEVKDLRVADCSAYLSPLIRDNPFLEYCSMHWGAHAKKELSDCARSLALQLFREYDSHISAVLLFNTFGDISDSVLGFLWSGLHCASYFGIVEVVAVLIEMGCYDLNEGDRFESTPLSLAAKEGHEEVVKILLAREEVSTNKEDTGGKTPLSWAAGSGREGVVKILLGREEVNPDKPNNWGQTPLSNAAQNGHEGMVKILLGREEVNPNKLDNNGRTLLSYAAEGGGEGLVKMLLERVEVDPDKPDNNGRTPLLYAAWSGREGVVKILLGWEEVNPDKPDNFGRTPLSYAAQSGNEGVVKTLLGSGEVGPDKPDNDGRTPLRHAADFGHEGVVKMLLGREEVNPDKPSNDGRTPLSGAATSYPGSTDPGRLEEVVKILLARDEVNPEKPDNRGQTPLSHAAGAGHEGIVKILLGREEVNPDKPDNDGRTPLLYAAQNDKVRPEEVVKLLLARDEVNPDKPDNEGRTPLSHAAHRGYDGVVKILLGLEEVNPDKPDNADRTPLSYAALNNYTYTNPRRLEEVVKLLLARDEVNPDKPDNRGQTPLSHAASVGHEGIVKILLGREEVNPEKPDNYGRTPLQNAALGGHEGIVKTLLAREEVDPDKPDNHGSTPLSLSAQYGHEDVVKILLAREEVDPENLDNDGDTPLACAASDGRDGVVKILLEQEGVNPDRPNQTGLTPLGTAAANGHEGVVKILLELEEVNPGKPDNGGQTPLMHAAKHGHQRVIDLLQPPDAATYGTLSALRDTS